MAHNRNRLSVVLLAALVALVVAPSSRADDLLPITTSTQPPPVAGSPCTPIGRVWIDPGITLGTAAHTWSCQVPEGGNQGLWKDSGPTPGGSNLTLQINNGGLFGPYAGATCSAGMALSGLSAAGAASCNYVVQANAAAATLGTCDASAIGKLQVKHVNGESDRLYVCLQNSDATFAWAISTLAVK